ncbi:MAG: 4-hydroxybenzoate polyprenyltransferase [Pseudomonadota bacterium]|jgi:4-hydroxybenzoate polyprenyltransferase
MKVRSPEQSGIVADAHPDNWVDRLAPGGVKPYLKLARFDRPIGAWLLLFPCWWAQALAELSLGRSHPDLWMIALFFAGAFVMRGAGCAWNDYLDHEYDARVARTASRPIPSGQITPTQAVAFGVALSFAGLAVLLQFNTFTIWLAISSLALVALYPLAKRFTYWPQIVLGLTFKWGALVGWAAVTGTLDWRALVLYAGSVFWTIGYDTIYAHQDKDDDAEVGLKSSALYLGERSHVWIAGFYLAAVALWSTAAAFSGAGLVFWVAMAGVAGQLAWQVATLDTGSRDNCLARFRSNRFVGWGIFLGLVAEMMRHSAI